MEAAGDLITKESNEILSEINLLLSNLLEVIVLKTTLLRIQ